MKQRAGLGPREYTGVHALGPMLFTAESSGFGEKRTMKCYGKAKTVFVCVPVCVQ